MELLTHLIDAAQGKHPLDTARSSRWPHARAEHLLKHPVCEVCGGADKLEVHHIKPFHLHPELELDPANFATLCEANKGGVNCHLLFGHLGSFKSFNTTVLQDAVAWRAKIKARPLTEDAP